jgi:RNA polymerase sigma-70 factor (ECF subfamily)
VSRTETQELVRSAQGGDEGARDVLLEQLRPRLVLWCASSLPARLRALYDAEDLAQEILLAVHGGLAGFRGADKRAFYAWVFRVAENRIRDLLDYVGAEKRKLPKASTFSQTSPSEAAMRGEARDRLRAALATLPDDYRTVMRMRRIEEREVPEIAAAMKRSENAVRILYFRALEALREALGDDV